MKTITPVGFEDSSARDTVVFDGGHAEVRDYVRGLVVGVAGMLQSRLPKPVRWLISADRIQSILGEVFDKLWPVGSPTPTLGEPGA